MVKSTRRNKLSSKIKEKTKKFIKKISNDKDTINLNPKANSDEKRPYSNYPDSLKMY